MWPLLDVAFVLFTALHLLVMFGAASPVDSPLKKPLLKTTRSIASHIDRPLVKMAGTVLLIASCVGAWRGGAWDDITMRTRFCAAFFTLLSLPLYMKVVHLHATFGTARVLELEQECADSDMLNWTPPPLAALAAVVAPVEQLLNVEAVGLENVPTDYPCFYVMNHSLMGVEMPSLIHLLYKEKGVYVRGLADHIHWAGPHGPLLRYAGAVDGTRPNVDLLMSKGQNLLVYPGGGAEIMKASSVERYTLMWKERLGFARMAIKNKYPILPCACVGTEDMLDIMLDLPLGFLAKKVGVPSVPVVKPNSLQKIYFWFGKPIPTEQFNGDADNTAFATEIRDKTKAAIEGGIKEMQQKQLNDPDRFFIDRVGKQIRDAQKKVDDGFRTILQGIKSD